MEEQLAKPEKLVALVRRCGGEGFGGLLYKEENEKAKLLLCSRLKDEYGYRIVDSFFYVP